MHGFARLKLVGTAPIDGVDRSEQDDVPSPLPFPTCMRELPIGTHGGCAAAQAILALDRVEMSLEKLRAKLALESREEGPHAA
jgi:hypothetical protein